MSDTCIIEPKTVVDKVSEQLVTRSTDELKSVGLTTLIEQAGIEFCDAHPTLVELAGPARIQRAFQIAMRCADIQQIGEGEFLIDSHIKEGLYYFLSHGHNTCSCPDYHLTQSQSDSGLGICVHALAVRFWLDGRAAFTQFLNEYDAAFACSSHRADGPEPRSGDERTTLPAWLTFPSAAWAEVSA